VQVPSRFSSAAFYPSIIVDETADDDDDEKEVVKKFWLHFHRNNLLSIFSSIAQKQEKTRFLKKSNKNFHQNFG
jgi:hypothetical protein